MTWWTQTCSPLRSPIITLIQTPMSRILADTSGADSLPYRLYINLNMGMTPDLWSWAYQALGVRSVIDVGCGEGHAARYFRDLGCVVLGIDGSQQAKRDSIIADHHVIHDYTQGPYYPPTGFDLAWSCEFVEHVQERYMGNFLETFACSRRYLMMTFAAPGQPGYHHVNCQPMDYWINKVESAGFHFDSTLTDTSRAISSEGHYKRRGLIFTRS